MRVVHPLEPIYNKESLVLILGSFPSIKSREVHFYYANKRNRFWKTLEIIFDEKIKDDNDSRKRFLLEHNIALFDVIKSCDIDKSKDSSIRNVVPNDIKKIVNKSNIKTIFTTGTMAYNLYNKYIYKDINIPAIKLPSTSPCNCKKGIDELLINSYSVIKEYLE